LEYVKVYWLMERLIVSYCFEFFGYLNFKYPELSTFFLFTKSLLNRIETLYTNLLFFEILFAFNVRWDYFSFSSVS